MNLNKKLLEIIGEDKSTRLTNGDYCDEYNQAKQEIRDKLPLIVEAVLEDFEQEIDKMGRYFFEENDKHEFIDTCEIYESIQIRCFMSVQIQKIKKILGNGKIRINNANKKTQLNGKRS